MYQGELAIQRLWCEVEMEQQRGTIEWTKQQIFPAVQVGLKAHPGALPPYREPKSATYRAVCPTLTAKKQPTSSSNALFSVFSMQLDKATTTSGMLKAVARDTDEVDFAGGLSEVTSAPLNNQPDSTLSDGDLDQGVSSYLDGTGIYYGVGTKR